MSADRRTLEESGLPELLGRMVKDAALKYKGGIPRLELVKSHPEFVVRLGELFDTLAAEREAMLQLVERPTWKTIQVGTMPSADVLRTALLAADFKIGDWGGDILAKVVVATEPTEIELVQATVAELGFPRGATRAQIYEAGLKLGWQLCPPEVGPQLRLQYPDQPNGEWILVAMEPITASGGYLGVFDVVRGGDDRWLNGRNGRPGGVWIGGGRWAFRRK
jgi:hypothetical protein